MIIATLGEKGGGGKSTIASQFLSAYFLKKYDEEGRGDSATITIFEFDAHNVSADDLADDSNVKTKHVGSNFEHMLEAISSIDYQSTQEDIIIDVGGSDNTDRFLELVKDESISSEIIFVLPEVNKRPRSVENTIKKLRGAIESPKIVIALNRYTGKVALEEEFKFFFGDSSMNIPASPLSKDKKLCISSIPACEISLGLANMDQVTLWHLSSAYRDFGSLSRDEKMEIWGGTGENGESIVCDHDTYVSKTKEVRQSKEAAETIAAASTLFSCLDKLSGDK